MCASRTKLTELDLGLGENWRVTHDIYAYTLSKRIASRRKNGDTETINFIVDPDVDSNLLPEMTKERWVVCGHYSNIEQLLEAFGNVYILHSPQTQALADIIKELGDIAETVRANINLNALMRQPVASPGPAYRS